MIPVKSNWRDSYRNFSCPRAHLRSAGAACQRKIGWPTFWGGDFYDFIELENAFRRLDGDRETFLERLFTEIGNFLAGESPLDDCTAIVVDLHEDFSTAYAGGK
jgi:hypothetical protein